MHDHRQHWPAGLDDRGVEGLGWGERDDHVGGGATQGRLERQRFVVIPGERRGKRWLRLEHAVDGRRWDEQAERLAGEGRSQITRLVGTNAFGSERAEKQPEADRS